MKLIASRVLGPVARARSSRFRHYRHCHQHKSTLTGIPLLTTVTTPFNTDTASRIALTDPHGQHYTYGEIVARALRLSGDLRQITSTSSGSGGRDCQQERVTFMCPRDASFVVTLWATWISGNIAVPLTDKHPDGMLEHFLRHTEARALVMTPEYADRLNRIVDRIGTRIGLQRYVLDMGSMPKEKEPSTQSTEPQHVEAHNALILFTSGTTGTPKGVLLSHANLADQVRNMCRCWGITAADTMLHVVPLHHTHGLIHALANPLCVGARVHMHEKFDAGRVWDELTSERELRPDVLTGVPSVYTKLIQEFDKTYGDAPGKAEQVKETVSSKMRVLLSGSASLPVPVLERIEQITGHRILERYGMTETGVMLSNTLHGVRRPGFVGKPIGESVQLRIVDPDTKVVVTEGKSGSVVGDLLVKGPSVFKEYWRNPEATRAEFTPDGWFITGDTVEYDPGDGAYKVLGRKSVDIIKSGGYKLSALEIETQLLALDEIREIAVCGIEDPVWGQRVGAMIVWNRGQEMGLDAFRELAKTRLPAYACPSVIKTVVGELPKNQLGKVNKKELVKLF